MSRILVVGDSMTSISKPYLEAIAVAAGHEILVHNESGSSCMDGWDGSSRNPAPYKDFVSAYAPDTVVIAYLGNAHRSNMWAKLGWSSMHNSPTPTECAAIGRIYQEYLGLMADWNNAHGIKTHLSATPYMAPATWHGRVSASINGAITNVCNSKGARQNAAARRLLAYQNGFAYSIANLPIRDTDGTHVVPPYGAAIFATGILSGAMTGDGGY